jgi:hypothetical protein
VAAGDAEVVRVSDGTFASPHAEGVSGQERLLRWAHRSLRPRRRKLGDPDSARCKFFTLARENVRRRTVGDRSPACGENNNSVDDIAPHRHTMLNNHNCCAGGFGNPDDSIPNFGNPLRIEIRGWLVKHDEPGLHCEDAGEREPLLLPTRKRTRVSVKSDVESDLFEAVTNAPPDFIARHPKIFATESDVVTDALQDHLTIGVLDYESGATTVCCRIFAVDKEGAFSFALIVANHAGKGMEERRLSRARFTEE